MRTRGSVDELERRRLLAVQRVQEGHTQAHVAQFLGVHVRTVGRWIAAYRQDRKCGLAAKPHPGRPPKLTPRQAGLVLGWLRKNPKSFGFATELWTAPRVAEVIQRKFKISFHPRYLNEWLTARDITPQKPQHSARERDEPAIQRWTRYKWPRIQNAPAAKGRIWP
jgi:transposase